MVELGGVTDMDALVIAIEARTLIQAHREECRENKRDIIASIESSRSDANAGRAKLHDRIDRIWYLALVGIAVMFLSSLAMTGAVGKMYLDQQAEKITHESR